jgi:uncharacterized membrane protein YccC
VSRKAKEAIKTALAMTLAYGIALSQGWDKPMWAGFAVAFVSLGSVGQSVDKAMLRMVGTFVAAAVSFVLLGCFAQDRWVFLLALSSWVGCCTYRIGGSRYPYAWQVSGFVAVILSLEAGFDAANAFRLATLRAQETGVGILVYSLVSLLVWPVHAGPKMRRAAIELVKTETELLAACLDLMRGGDVATTRALRAKARQQQSSWKQLLAAASTDSIEVEQHQAQWRAFAQQIDSLTDAIDRCCDAVFGQSELDVDRFLPSLRAFQDEIGRRFDVIGRALGGEVPDHTPSKILLSPAEAALASGARFQRAALTAATSQLLRVESLTRDLWATSAAIGGSGGQVREPAPPPKRVYVYDPDRLSALVRVLLMQWLSYVALIYVPDLPGGVGVAILTGSLGISVALFPQMSVLKLIGPALASTIFAGVVYIFIMPRLSSFVGLGTVIFAVTFAICYLFAAPQQALGRALGLAMFVTVASISNEQSYSFLSVASTALMLPLVFLIISVGSYVPLYLRADRMILRLLARFFRSSAYATHPIALGGTKRQRAGDARKHAFHARELATIPQKIEGWKPWVDVNAHPGTSPEKIQGLADSTAFLSRALTTLAERARETSPSAVQTALGEDLHAWHMTLQDALGRLADDPTAGRVESARERLTEITAELEVRTRDALDSGGGDPLVREDEEQLYLLLAAYRSISEALADYVEKAASIDWIPWHEERFA